MPQMERPDSDEEIAYQVQLKIRGEAEERRMYDNYMQGDYLGLEDGRPGISIGDDGTVYMPFGWRLILYFGVLAVIAILAFGTRACVGEERTQQILHGDTR